jgi:DNA-binding CsgD family transcriptional regulator
LQKRSSKRSEAALVEQVYRATLEPGEWCAVLGSLAATCNAHVGVMGTSGLRPDSWIIPTVAIGASSTLRDVLDTRYRVSAASNPLLAPAMKLPSGCVVRIEELVPLRMLERSEMYETLMRPAGAYHGVGINLCVPGVVGGMNLHRERRAGRFTVAEVAVMERLAPHVVSATRLAQRLERAESQAALAWGTLEQLQAPVLLVAADARIAAANHSARALLAAGTHLKARNQRLEAAGTAEHASLLASIFRAATTRRGEYSCAGDTLCMAGPAGRISLTIAPLAAARSVVDWPAGELAIVVAQVPARVADAATRLRLEFGLTGAESRLLQLIGNGVCVKEGAQRLGVSINTVRTHLQHVFQKTGTRRQAELVRLVLGSRSPAAEGVPGAS